jgi:DNA-binding MarR family transcriptional regulator
MASRKHVDPTVDQIDSFIDFVSRLALSGRVQQRFAGTTNLVTRSELSALRALGRHRRLTYGELAERLVLDPTTVSRLATGLLDLGLVTREPDESDKRRAWLALTPAGGKVLQSVESVYIEYYEVAIAEWTPEERTAARQVLARLRDSLTHLEFDETGRATRVAPARSDRTA